MNKPEPATPKGRPVLRILRRTVRVVTWVLVSLVALLVLVGVALYLPPVQSLLRNKVVAFVEERTGADVHLGRIALRFPVGLTLRDLSVADPSGDTLLAAGLIRARLSVTGLLGREIELQGVRLEGVHAHLVQHADSSFNFDFIVEGFAGSDTVETPSADTTAGWGFRVHDLTLRDIRYEMRMEPSGLELGMHLGRLELDLKGMDLDASRYRVGD
ncbi:MAG TPA: AsmA family protein, partial [Flavobacteriales bacterium]|nr:AsmA family protein [Flavobacteriales bacterium]